MSEKNTKIDQEEPENRSPKVDLSNPIMTNRRYKRLLHSMKELHSEATKNTILERPRRFRVINVFCFISLVLGLIIMMQGNILGLPILLGSIVTYLFASSILEKDD
jgi:hypothetical protein